MLEYQHVLCTISIKIVIRRKYIVIYIHGIFNHSTVLEDCDLKADGQLVTEQTVSFANKFMGWLKRIIKYLLNIWKEF